MVILADQARGPSLSKHYQFALMTKADYWCKRTLRWEE